jgi:hypothetical protein
MKTFVAVDDDLVSQRIRRATSRIILVAPAVSRMIAEALGACFARAGDISITVVLDQGEEAYRLGYGDREGLEQLQRLASTYHIGIRAQSGLRIGLLVADNDVLVWSPTPISVESKRTEKEPNGVQLTGSQDNAALASIVDILRAAVGSDDSDILPEQAELGRQALNPADAAETVKALTQNPPAPFDLSRKTRVFSTRFQFVEPEVRGAAWTKREIKLSSLLLNPDVPDALRDLFETKIRPFSAHVDTTIEVPALVRGQIAYNREGEPITCPMSQADIDKLWKEIQKRYLTQLGGFGWLVQRAEVPRFKSDIEAYEIVLKAWVAGFRRVAGDTEAALVSSIVNLIMRRAAGSAKAELLDAKGGIETMVRTGIQRLRIIEPGVKLVFKDVSWESTRDAEFMDEFRKALPVEAQKGWFEEFTAARQRPD